MGIEDWQIPSHRNGRKDLDIDNDTEILIQSSFYGKGVFKMIENTKCDHTMQVWAYKIRFSEELSTDNISDLAANKTCYK